MLRYGLERLARDFPWIAGNVIYDETDHLYKIIPTGVIPLIVNELRQETVVPAMSHLRAAGFPCEFLEESLVAPYPTIDRFQAASHPAKHSVTDVTGQYNIMALFSKACHGTLFTEEELAIGMMDRTKVIPLLDDSYDIWNPGPELDNHIQKPQTKSSTGQATNMTWACVDFSQESLHRLKSQATATKDSSTPFVSTDDAICAFIWKRISCARLN
ncbi:Acetyltransferase [Penicillium citrinum]|uniref:Acetyltransferase n=1 Tax=Penicillium citrinum TaxID=5077 RepID=A0A9W9TPQ8_PENCI|nr:Acetyltransferase [Penicillium citrinum]KAJ5233768.1 Acetyltransferase [Penicillium citrinum]